MITTTLNALAEPNRLRIIEMLRERPYSVNELTTALGISQPQVTRHLQTLERAGLVMVYPLAQRRIYALKAEPLKTAYAWLQTFRPNWENPPHALEAHIAAIQKEQDLAAQNSNWAEGRHVTFTRRFGVSRAKLWELWTMPAEMKRWWSPDYLTTSHAEADVRTGGKIRIEMQEPDGVAHSAEGAFTEVQEPKRLGFIMAPLDTNGNRLFEARYTVQFTEVSSSETELELEIRLGDSTKAAASYIAGIELGWTQTLNKLERLIEGSESTM